VPEVSVVMPAREAARTIGGAVRSVLGQTFRDLELLVVDDGSADETGAEAVRAAGPDERLRLVRRASPGGPGAARNDALGLASGRWAAFLDADDLWLTDKLERQVAFARATGAVLTYTAYHRVNGAFDGGIDRWRPEGRVVHVPKSRTYAQLLRHNCVGCLTAMCDAEAASGAGMPDLPGAEDFGLWLALLRGGAVARGLDEPLAVYRAHARGSVSSGGAGMARATWRLFREVERLGAARSAAALAGCIAASLRKSRI
jgi:glycosyltransferase involved in cell wall biosynthesis